MFQDSRDLKLFLKFNVLSDNLLKFNRISVSFLNYPFNLQTIDFTLEFLKFMKGLR